MARKAKRGGVPTTRPRASDASRLVKGLRRLRRNLGDPANLLQLVIALLVALPVLAGALLSSQASDDWQRALRDDIKRSAAALEDIRFVYTDEARPAFRIAMAEVRAEELELEAGSAAARFEAGTEAQTAAQLRFAERGKGTLVDGDRYQAPDHSFDLPRRLADMRARHPGLVRLDPDAGQRAGDETSRRAFLLSCLVFPLVAGYLLLQVRMVRRRTGRRRSQDAGLIPEPIRQDARRVSVSVALLAWMTLTLIAPLQLLANNGEQREHAMAARYANRLSATIEASGIVASFGADARRMARDLGVRSATRQYVLIDATAAESAQHSPVAAADERTAARSERLVRTMGRIPGSADGVDPATRALLAGDKQDLDRLSRDQARHADLADSAGTRNTRLTVAILFAAFALSLASFAGSVQVKRRERLWRVWSRWMLAISVVITVAAYLA
ncbi:hypothetical protein [Nonomuraea lactucae]|uniref:hypothetical protein n=1 Tax=Nonomuraea lactucae TaxID=2249762 RepID=UPI000DE2C1A3|nr:hypothetical protein [Nonomuraea lactucae]